VRIGNSASASVEKIVKLYRDCVSRRIPSSASKSPPPRSSHDADFEQTERIGLQLGRNVLPMGGLPDQLLDDFHVEVERGRGAEPGQPPHHAKHADRRLCVGAGCKDRVSELTVTLAEPEGVGMHAVVVQRLAGALDAGQALDLR
jgi:hypothetical protein